MLSDRLSPGCGVIPSDGGSRLGHCGRIADRGQLDHPNPIGEGGFQARGDLQGEPCLSDAADAGQGHQPVCFDSGFQLSDGHLAADEAGGLRFEIARRRIERLQRREFGAQSVGSNLEQLHWPRDVA